MSWPVGARVKVTNNGQTYSTHPARVQYGCREARFTENASPNNGDEGLILQFNADHNSCAIAVGSSDFLVGCSGLQVIAPPDANAAPSDGAKAEAAAEEPLEWNGDGYWSASEGASGGSAVRFFITKTNLADAPYIHIKRIRLIDTKGNPVPFTAHCDRRLKVSRHQPGPESQDPVSGKYRPARLAEPPPTTRTKWAAVAPRGEADPVVLELRPANGRGFPVLAGYEFDNGIRTSRYPATWRFQQRVGNRWVTLQEVDDCPGSFCESRIELPKQPSLAFRADARLFDAVAAQDVAACMHALHNAGGSAWGLGTCTNLSELQLAVAKTGNLRLLSLFSLLGPMTPPAIKQAFASGNMELVRFVCRSQPVSRKFFKYALAAQSLAAFEHLASVRPQLLRDAEDYVVGSAGATRSLLTAVVEALAKLKSDAGKPEDVPDFEVLKNPNAAILRSALAGGDTQLFLQLAKRTSHASLLAFLVARLGKGRPPIGADLLEALLDSGTSLEGIVDAALDVNRLDLVRLLLDSGYPVSGGLDSSLLTALLSGDDDKFDLLWSYGAACPGYVAFGALVQQADLSVEAATKAIATLKRHGILDPSAVLPKAGITLVERALAHNHFRLVSALTANGAARVLPSGATIFQLLVDKLADAKEILGLLPQRGPEDAAHISHALHRFVVLHADELPSLDDVRAFVDAGADINAVENGQTVATLIIKHAKFSRQLLDQLVGQLGANLSVGPDPGLVALGNQAIGDDDFDYLYGLRPHDTMDTIWALLTGPSLKKLPRSRHLLERLSAGEDANLADVRPTVWARVVGDHELYYNVKGGDWETLRQEKTMDADTAPDATRTDPLPLIIAAAIYQRARIWEPLYNLGARVVDFEHPRKDILGVLLVSAIQHVKDSEQATKLWNLIVDNSFLPPAQLLALAACSSLGRLPTELVLGLADLPTFNPDYEASDLFPPLVPALIKSKAPLAVFEKVLRGANVAPVEEKINDSLLGLLVHLYGSEAHQNNMADIFRLLLDAGASYSRPFVDPKAPQRGLPASHFLGVRSGKESTSTKAGFKKCFLALFEKGFAINTPRGNRPVDGETSTFWDFARATVMDCNYAASENLQRFFRKRDGERQYANRDQPI